MEDNKTRDEFHWWYNFGRNPENAIAFFVGATFVLFLWLYGALPEYQAVILAGYVVAFGTQIAAVKRYQKKADKESVAYIEGEVNQLLRKYHKDMAWVKISVRDARCRDTGELSVMIDIFTGSTTPLTIVSSTVDQTSGQPGPLSIMVEVDGHPLYLACHELVSSITLRPKAEPFSVSFEGDGMWLQAHRRETWVQGVRVVLRILDFKTSIEAYTSLLIDRPHNA